MIDKLAAAKSRIGETFTNFQGARARIIGISDRRQKGSGNALFRVRLDSGGILDALLRNLQSGHFKDYSLPTVYGVGISRRGARCSLLYKTWSHMLERCYSHHSARYSSYGGAGVSVCDRWLTFSNFERDAVFLPGYAAFLESPSKYSLDKDIRGNGKLYSLDTCMFATAREQSHAQVRVRKLKAIDRQGREQVFDCKLDACKALGVHNANLYAVLRGERKYTQGYTFVEI